MTPDVFVRAIIQVVAESSALGVLHQLRKPSGRTPAEVERVLSTWFTSLDGQGQERVREIVERTAKQATYNFLLVIDGLLAIEKPGPKSKVALTVGDAHIAGGEVLPDGEALSSMFKRLAH
jgi:hypothetical protein